MEDLAIVPSRREALVKTLRDYEEGSYIFVTYFAKEFAENQ
ncbi:hypothetical protein N8385_05435 [Cyclobacteriaceae bacterium]|nr:hypothetical protein [Cyclobacteriaceae bacterium]